MPGLTWNTSELLTDIRAQALLADDEPEAAAEVLLAEATRLLHTVYAPAVRRVRSDYYVQEATIPLAAGVSMYALPHRAVTASVRRVRWVDSAGRERALQPVSIEDAGAARHNVGRTPEGYALLDGAVCVYPVPTAAEGYLLVLFEYRPAMLVETTSASLLAYAVIGVPGTPPAYADGVYTVQVSMTAGDIDIGDTFDLVMLHPPFSTTLLGATVTDSTSLGGGYYDLAATAEAGWREPVPLTGTRTGYCMTTDTSAIPQIPPELHPVLATHVAAKFLRSRDPEASKELLADAERRLKDVLGAMSPRKQGTQQKIRSTTSYLRNRRRRVGNTFADWE